MRGSERKMVTTDHVESLAEMVGMVIHPDHLPGVTLNLNIVLEQAALLLEPPLDALVEPAPVFRP